MVRDILMTKCVSVGIVHGEEFEHGVRIEETVSVSELKLLMVIDNLAD